MRVRIVVSITDNAYSVHVMDTRFPRGIWAKFYDEKQACIKDLRDAMSINFDEHITSLLNDLDNRRKLVVFQANVEVRFLLGLGFVDKNRPLIGCKSQPYLWRDATGKLRRRPDQKNSPSPLFRR
jgi:hypothetical protein